MTFSLLAFDPVERIWGACAATGSICVGGWVLRGSSTCGLSASQGHAPSTIWGEEVLDLQKAGMDASSALDRTVSADAGKEYRQLSTIDLNGETAAFSGTMNKGFCGHIVSDNFVASGNILANSDVLQRMVDAYLAVSASMEERLLLALKAGQAAGGDSRGLMSASMLCVSEHKPPLNLRIDYDSKPINALAKLLALSQETKYAEWIKTLPTTSSPHRHDTFAQNSEHATFAINSLGDDVHTGVSVTEHDSSNSRTKTGS